MSTNLSSKTTTLETLERVTGRDTKKAIVLLLRWVLVIACSGLILSSNQYAEHKLVAHLLVLFLFSTNIALSVIPLGWFNTSYFDHVLTTVDVFLISATIWYSGEVSGDLYLLYFVSIIVAAMGETLRAIFWSTFLVVAVYLSVSAGVEGVGAILRPEFLVRVPFFFVVALFYGYFAQLVRRERSTQLEIRQKLDVTQQIREIGSALSESLDRQQILQTLVQSQRTLCGAEYCSVVSVSQQSVLAEAGNWGKSEDRNRYRVLFNTLQVELDNYLLSDSSSRPAVVSLPRKPRNSSVTDTLSGSGQVCFVHDRFTFLPVSGKAQSDLYLCLLGNFPRETMGYASLILWNASMALKKAGQYQQLVQEVEKRQTVVLELSEALSFKTGFIKKISDELKTPVYSFIGFCELMLNGGYGSLNEEQREVMKRMLENARSLRNLVNRVLDHTKFDFGCSQLFYETSEVGQIVDQVVKSCRPLLEDKAVVLIGEKTDEAISFTSDLDMVRQILVNFVSNAIKFTEEGEVSLAYSLDESTDEIIFVVRDTGSGISASEIERIFVPFRSLENGYAESYNGTGLGLSVNKRQAQLLGGKISVNSELGVGSEFTLTIPRAQLAAGTSIPVETVQPSQ